MYLFFGMLISNSPDNALVFGIPDHILNKRAYIYSYDTKTPPKNLTEVSVYAPSFAGLKYSPQNMKFLKITADRIIPNKNHASHWYNAIISKIAEFYSPEDMNFLLKIILDYDEALTSFTRDQAIISLIIHSPEISLKLLNKSRFSYSYIATAKKIPASALYEGFAKYYKRIKSQHSSETYPLQSFFNKNFRYLSRKTQKTVCNTLVSALLSQNQNDFQIEYSEQSLLSKCYVTYNNPFWIITAGYPVFIKKLLPLLTFRSDRIFPSIWATPLMTLLKEYSADKYWEKSFRQNSILIRKQILDLLGRTQNKKALDEAVKHLNDSIWIRKTVLRSLSTAPLPYAGQLLIETAKKDNGDEAVYFFLPFINNCKNQACHKINSEMVSLSLEYLKAKEPLFRYAALFVLSQLQNSEKYEKYWYPIAKKEFKRLIKEKNTDDAVKILSILIKSPKFTDTAVKLLNDTQHIRFRETAVLGLAHAQNPKILKKLEKLAFSPNIVLAHNAIHALGNSKNSEVILQNLLLKIRRQPVQTQVMYRLLIKAWQTPNPSYCKIFTEFYKKPQNRRYASSVLYYLLKRCPQVFKPEHYKSPELFIPFVDYPKLFPSYNFVFIDYYVKHKKNFLKWALKVYFKQQKQSKQLRKTPLVSVTRLKLSYLYSYLPLYFKGFIYITDTLPEQYEVYRF